MKKNYYIPFDSNGNLIVYTGLDITDADDKDGTGTLNVSNRGEIVDKEWRGSVGQHPYIYKRNYKFYAPLEYTGYTRGRSAARMCFKDAKTGCRYEMFLNDFDEIMKAKGFRQRTISEIWTFVKCGSNFGIKMA